MSHLTLSQPLRPAGPVLADYSAGNRGRALRFPPSSQNPKTDLNGPRITLHLHQSRACILSLAPGTAQTAGSLVADSVIIVNPVVRFLLTFLLALLILASAAVVAFGTHPALAKYPAGMSWITTARTLQWPLTTLCLILCLMLIGLVVSGKRRVVWLFVLAPVLFLFYQRFAGDPFRRMAILDNPNFVSNEKAAFLKSESPVIGLVFEGQPYAYPCGALALAPVVLHAEGDKRLFVMYSPYAGRARAFVVDPTIKSRELDIVSMPANALLLYNSRIGQFINAFTGTTPKGERPEGFHAAVDVKKTTWREWRSQYPDTKVLATTVSHAGERVQARFPARPVGLELPNDARVAVLATTRPVALQTSTFPVEIVNVRAGGISLLIFRDKGKVKVFDRTVKNELFPTFARKSIMKKPEVAFADSDTGSLWNAEGRCLEGFAKGEQLRPIYLEEDVSYVTLKSFYPDLELLKF